MGSQHQPCLKVRNRVSTLSAFSELLKTQSLVDVTLVCHKLKLKAHKVVLAARSSYFREIFEENPCERPVVIFDGSWASLLEALLRFVYDGEANVPKSDLDRFLALAKSFQLCDFGSIEISKGIDDADERANDRQLDISNGIFAGIGGEGTTCGVVPRADSAADLDGQMRNNAQVDQKPSREMLDLAMSQKVSDDKLANTSIRDTSAAPGDLHHQDQSCGARSTSLAKGSGSTCPFEADRHIPTPNRTQIASTLHSRMMEKSAVAGASNEPAQTLAGPSGIKQFESPKNQKPKCDRITAKQKTNIIDLFLNERMSFAEISRRLDVPLLKVQNLINRHKKASAVKLNPAKGHRRQFQRLDADQQAKLLDFVRARKKINRVGIQKHVKRAFRKSISVLYISKLLKDNGVKLDRPASKNSKVTSRRSLASVQSRREYARSASQLLKQNKPFVFIDECAIESKVGRPSGICVLSALAKTGLRTVSWMSASGPEAFVEFLEQLLRSSASHVLVMPDTALNRSTRVTEWIREMKCWQLFLPPGSPSLNPLQKPFRDWQRIGSGLGAEDLRLYGQQLCGSRVTEVECNQWIQESFKYLSSCLKLPRPKTTVPVISPPDSIGLIDIS